MAKIYIAGASADPEPCKVLRDKLTAEGHTILAAWLDLNPEHLPPEEVIWTTCMNQICLANVMVIVVPEKALLQGAIFEAGYAAALRIPRIIFDPFNKVLGDWKHSGRTYLASTEQSVIEILGTVK